MSALTWRPMRPDDLDAVTRIAAVGFPDHFEGRDCFENRLALYPEGGFVLSGEAGIVGYLVAYPWRFGAVPPLNTTIASIPGDADVLYLHDLALMPDARGGGWTRPVLDRLASEARSSRWSKIALVAVNDAQAFWRRHGFGEVQDRAMQDKLASYGADARYMVRSVS